MESICAQRQTFTGASNKSNSLRLVPAPLPGLKALCQQIKLLSRGLEPIAKFPTNLTGDVIFDYAPGTTGNEAGLVQQTVIPNLLY